MDWNLGLVPEPAWAHLIKNPLGEITTSGVLGLEVQPPFFQENGTLYNTWAPDAATRFLAPLAGRRAIACGAWVRDRSHKYDGTSIGLFDNGDHGWMELHPIVALAVELRTDAVSSSWEFFAFADTAVGHGRKVAPGAGHTVFNSMNDMHRVLEVALPRAGLTAQSRDLIPQVDSALVTLITRGDMDNGGNYARFEVQTGTPVALNDPIQTVTTPGFYHAAWEFRPAFG